MIGRRTSDDAMLAELWEQHQQDSFPPGLAGAEVEGIDVTTLVTLASGCLNTYFQQGRLDAWRAALLGICYRDLAIVIRAVEGQAYVYFQHLEELSGLILQEVVSQQSA